MTVIDLSTERGKIALAYAGSGYARDLVRNLVEAQPDISGQELLAALNADFETKLDAADRVDEVDETFSPAVTMHLAAAGIPVDAEYEHGTCRRCAKPVVRNKDGGFITHTDASRLPTKVGCRAASFTPEDGWDDTIDRKSKATWSQ